MTETDTQIQRLGYARLSTYGQMLDAQLEQFRAEGRAKTFREKVSGARADRRELRKLLNVINPRGVATRIAPLAYSTFDLFVIAKRIVNASGQFPLPAEPWAPTSTGRLMIAVLGRSADVERDLIRTRTAEGRSRSMACGQHMGRPLKLTLQKAVEARRRRAGRATLKELAKSYTVGAATISRLGR